MLRSVLVLLVAVSSVCAQADSNPAVTRAFGAGFSVDGDSYAPQFASSAPVIGGNVGVQLSNARPNAVGFLAISNVPTSYAPYAGGTSYVDMTDAYVAAPFLIPQSGVWTLVAPLTFPPSMVGKEFHLQCLTIDGGGTEGKVALSNGVFWRLGY